MDILIFAVIAAVLIYRLNSVLGTRHGDERQRPNPFSPNPQPKNPLPAPVAEARPVMNPEVVGQLIDPAFNKEGQIEAGLADIVSADPGFDVNEFMDGAKYAFEVIVTSYAKGDRAALKPLLSQKIYADFDHGIAERELLAQTTETEIHRITGARIVEAHLGGTMAYITVDFSVEQTTVVRDSGGAIVEGNDGQPAVMEDIWTFTRDTRSPDPNWILIETRTVEKPAS